MASVLTFRCNEVMKLIDPSFESRDGYLPPGCCWSCHDDEDLGYPLMNPYIDGREAEICCAIYRLVEASSLRHSLQKHAENLEPEDCYQNGSVVA